MNLKAKTYVQDQKLVAEQKLAARQAILSQNGMNPSTIGRDPMIRKFLADIRKSRLRLKSIAAQEKLLADLVQAKADKEAAKKAGLEQPKVVEKKVEAKTPKKEKKPKEKKAAAPQAG